MNLLIDPLQNLSARQQYMGGTPGKFSSTGVDVMVRMFTEGKLRVGASGVEIHSAEGEWIAIGRTDMSHIVDAVDYWNREGYATGPQSDEVRTFMLDPANYVLERSTTNRSRGAATGKRYRPPYKQ